MPEGQAGGSMTEQFKKIQNLINATGDRCIVVDTNGEALYVIIPFREFEKIVQDRLDVKGLSEEEFLEKINRDIAHWRSSQEDEQFDDWEFTLSAKKDKEVAEDREKNEHLENMPEIQTTDQTYYFEPIDWIRG